MRLRDGADGSLETTNYEVWLSLSTVGDQVRLGQEVQIAFVVTKDGTCMQSPSDFDSSLDIQVSLEETS